MSNWQLPVAALEEFHSCSSHFFSVVSVSFMILQDTGKTDFPSWRCFWPTAFFFVICRSQLTVLLLMVSRCYLLPVTRSAKVWSWLTVQVYFSSCHSISSGPLLSLSDSTQSYNRWPKKFCRNLQCFYSCSCSLQWGLFYCNWLAFSFVYCHCLDWLNSSDTHLAAPLSVLWFNICQLLIHAAHLAGYRMPSHFWQYLCLEVCRVSSSVSKCVVCPL